MFYGTFNDEIDDRSRSDAGTSAVRSKATARDLRDNRMPVSTVGESNTVGPS
jgi:hypothetical protein